MKPLNLEKALELYNIIGKFLPENPEIGTEILDFVGIIIENIKQSGEHKRYVEAVSLMSGKELEEVFQFESQIVLEMFIKGLVENRILDLREFVKGLSDARS